MAVLDKQFYISQIKRSAHGNYRPHGDPAKAEGVLAAGFGYRHAPDGSVVPSLSTRQIAQYLRQFEHLPKVLTHDVASAYRKLGPVAEDLLFEVHHPHQKSSINLANHFRDYVKTMRWNSALLIGHQHHLPWLDYLCGQISIPTVVPPGLQFAFDPVSAQPWTRDAESWKNEIESRLKQGYDEAYHYHTYQLHHS